MNRLRKWGKELLLLLIIFAIASWGMDLWRKPTPPDLQRVPSMILMDGTSVSIEELSAEKPLLVYFWASWCGVCKFTSPTVSELASTGNNVLSIAIRSGDDSKLSRGMEIKDLHFPTVNDVNGRLSSEWGISATPTFIIYYQGKVVSYTSGWTSSLGLKARLWWAEH